MKYSHFLLSGITGWMLCLYPYCATAELPSGGDIVSGAGTVSQSGNTLTVNQSTNKLSVNWDNFNIGADNTVQFIQPDRSSIALNRVVGSDGSRIMGKLLANGQVFLINPNGILFGQTAQVDVGGLVASTLNLSEDDFRNGNMVFRGDGGEVINRGVLQSELGYLALLGSHVSNEGTLLANYGTVALAAGNQITLDFSGDQLINVGVDAAAFNALAENKQLIRANGGKVIMTARATGALFDTVVSNEGVIEARTLSERNGVIVLLGDMEQGTVNVDGVLDASAPEGGDGGFIETSGAHVKVADTAHITTLAPHGETGQWLVDPNDLTIASSGGDITGTTLSTLLGSTNITLQSIDGAVVAGNGDIFVNDTISWGAATTLTLLAERNVDVNQAITASGAGNLVLRADSGATGIGTVNFGVSGSVSVASGRADLYYNPNSYATPTDYSGDISGTYTAWMLVNDVNDLQDMDTNLAGDYALGADIDASATSTWNGGVGFIPVGHDNSNIFTGQFDGLYHVISGLTLNDTSFLGAYSGLFGRTTGAIIRNVGLVGGSIIGNTFTGALVGYDTGSTITNSFSSMAISSVGHRVGGLIGITSGGTTVNNTYVTGDVSGDSFVGGLIGQVQTTNGANIITNSYTTGAVSTISPTGNYIGGFIGIFSAGGAFSNNFWNTDTTLLGLGSGTNSGLTGLTSAEMMNAANFSALDNTVWRIYDGYTTPLLKGFMTPVTVTANNDSKTYDAATYTGTPGVTYSDPSVAGSLLGTLSYASSGINAGTYTLSTTGLYSDQQGYDITFVDGTLTINQAAITLSTSDVIKTYDGTTSAAGTAAVTSGSLFGSDSLSGGTFAFTGPNAGTGKTVSVSGITVNDGNGGGNYAVTYADNNTSTINQATLTLTSSDVIKTYDGTATAAGTAQVASGSLFGSDSLGGGTFTFTDPNAGINKTVTVTNVTVNDGNGGNNYTVTYVDNTTSTINQATLTITADDQSIVAGNMIPLLTATAVGLVAGDTNSLITGLSTTATSSSPAGSYVIDASGASAGPNYLIAVANDGTLTITAAPVTTPPISDINDTIGNTIGITINNPSLNPNQPGFIDDDADGESAIRTNREQQANTVMQFDRIALNIADGGIKMPSATVIQTCHSSKEDEGFAVTDCIEVKQHSGYIIQP